MNEVIVRLNARIANQRDQISHLHFVVCQLKARLASVDTHPKDGDVKQAPLVSGAVGEAETPGKGRP